MLYEEKIGGSDIEPLNMKDYPHEVANVIKEILRESVESVCPPSLYDEFLSITVERNSEEVERAELIKIVMEKLPISRIHIFAYVIFFMKTVVLFCEMNKMGEQNIAMMFAPNMFRHPKYTALSEISLLGIKNDLLRIMMKYTSIIFGQKLVS